MTEQTLLTGLMDEIRAKYFKGEPVPLDGEVRKGLRLTRVGVDAVQAYYKTDPGRATLGRAVEVYCGENNNEKIRRT